MTEPRTVSVALATFNGAKYIQTQLDSILAQTRQPDELVVCDDHSSDDTVLILENFAKKVSYPVKIFSHAQNRGFVATFNKALEEASGDLVFLCDQDDYWFPEKVASTCLLAAQNPKFKLWMNDAELTDEVLCPSGFTTLGQMSAAGQRPQDLVLGCCMAVRRDLLEVCLPISSDFPAHDIWLHEFAEVLDSKQLITEVLQYYRRHHQNETTHIVYSMRKINRLDYKIDFYKKLFFSGRTESLSQRIANNSLRIDALGLALSKVGSKDIKKIEAARNRYQAEVEILKERLKLSQMTPLDRVPFAFKLLSSGRYSSGIKSFLRDILGNSR